MCQHVKYISHAITIRAQLTIESCVLHALAINMVLWFYGQMRTMKTTFDIPDELYRRAKAEAALRGRKLRDLVEEGLRSVIETPHQERPRPRLADLMGQARG